MKSTKFLQLIAAIILSISFFACKSPNNSSVSGASNQSASTPSNPPTAPSKESSPRGQPKAEIIKTRLVPFVTAQGKSAQMVLTDWKNTGMEPIKEVYADISAYDERGNLLSASVKDYCIFAVESDSKAIKPGETYTEPDGEGFILIPFPPENAKVKRVTVTVTRLSSGGSTETTPKPLTTLPVSPSQPIGSTEERLAVAAQIRHYLRDQDIPALVVASGTKLTISYRVALIEYAPDTFFRQQGEEGMKRIANAGFKTLVIEANDTSGRTQRKEFSVTQYRIK
jgi:hypothetical protein